MGAAAAVAAPSLRPPEKNSKGVYSVRCTENLHAIHAAHAHANHENKERVGDGVT